MSTLSVDFTNNFFLEILPNSLLSNDVELEVDNEFAATDVLLVVEKLVLISGPPLDSLLSKRVEVEDVFTVCSHRPGGDI